MAQKTVFITIILCGLLGILYASLTYKNKQEQDCLTVGMMSGYAPFLTINDNGEFEGYEFELAQALARTLKKRLVVKDMNFSPLLQALELGEIDVMIADIAITNERQEKITLLHYRSAPKAEFPIVFWKKIPVPHLYTLEDLRPLGNITICVETGTILEKLLNKYDFITQLPINRYIDALAALKEGAAIAAIMMEEVVMQYQKQVPELAVSSISLEECATNGVGLALRTSNKMLIQEMDAAITELKANGTLALLAKKWCLDA